MNLCPAYRRPCRPHPRRPNSTIKSDPSSTASINESSTTSIILSAPSVSTPHDIIRNGHKIPVTRPSVAPRSWTLCAPRTNPEPEQHPPPPSPRGRWNLDRGAPPATAPADERLHSHHLAIAAALFDQRRERDREDALTCEAVAADAVAVGVNWRSSHGRAWLNAIKNWRPMLW